MDPLVNQKVVQPAFNAGSSLSRQHGDPHWLLGIEILVRTLTHLCKFLDLDPPPPTCRLSTESEGTQLAYNSGPAAARQRYAIELRIAGGPLVALQCMLAGKEIIQEIESE